jgi:hypothetical protein
VDQQRFNLAFEEGYCEEDPRRCCSVRRIDVLPRGSALLVKVEPPVDGTKYGLNQRDISMVLLTADNDLFPIREWPKRVHVHLPLVDPEMETPMTWDMAKRIAWGNLYLDPKEAVRWVIEQSK